MRRNYKWTTPIKSKLWRVVYVRGGDFGSNWDDELPVNPT